MRALVCTQRNLIQNGYVWQCNAFKPILSRVDPKHCGRAGARRNCLGVLGVLGLCYVSVLGVLCVPGFPGVIGVLGVLVVSGLSAPYGF